ncbi:MAG: hypothetical protein L6Q57_00495 [Alphaproteobacteria bacterium]|nr:hypothetical protein [Alphaproteobacteria bacterium]
MQQAHRLARAGAVDDPQTEMAVIFAQVSYKIPLPTAPKQRKPEQKPPRRSQIINHILNSFDGNRADAQALVGRALAI